MNRHARARWWAAADRVAPYITPVFALALGAAWGVVLARFI